MPKKSKCKKNKEEFSFGLYKNNKTNVTYVKNSHRVNLNTNI
jgi:hypothetical protein